MYFFMKYGLLTKTKSKPALIYIYYITFKKSYIIHTFIEGGIFYLIKVYIKVLCRDRREAFREEKLALGGT